MITNMDAAKELKEEYKEREAKSHVHGLLESPVEVTDEVLQHCRAQGRFEALAFELYKETAILLNVASNASTAESGVLTRNQAICAGLLMRIVKFRTVVLQLSTSDNRGEIAIVLNRSIQESAVNLRFLLLKDEDRFFDQFVEFRLGPERELYDSVQSNIAARGGQRLPIEERMLASIDRACKASGKEIAKVDPKPRDWGGNVRNRLLALGQENLYVPFRLVSHAVHGTWVDLLS